jgi:hypothetical protein
VEEAVMARTATCAVLVVGVLFVIAVLIFAIALVR